MRFALWIEKEGSGTQDYGRSSENILGSGGKEGFLLRKGPKVAGEKTEVFWGDGRLSQELKCQGLRKIKKALTHHQTRSWAGVTTKKK